MCLPLILSLDVNTVDNRPLMKIAIKPLLRDVVEVNDEDTTTCVTVPANDPTTIMVPVFDAQNDSITVKILTHHEESCLSYKDSDVYVMVKMINCILTYMLRVPISEGTLSGNSYPLIYNKLKPSQSLKVCFQMMCWKMLKFRMKTMFL